MTAARFLLPEWLIARLEAECLMDREAIHATFRALDPPLDPPAPLPVDRIAERCAELTLPPCHVTRRESRSST